MPKLFSCRSLTALPTEIQELKCLETLVVTFNRLSDYPYEIEQLENLQQFIYEPQQRPSYLTELLIPTLCFGLLVLLILGFRFKQRHGRNQQV